MYWAYWQNCHGFLISRAGLTYLVWAFLKLYSKVKIYPKVRPWGLGILRRSARPMGCALRFWLEIPCKKRKGSAWRLGREVELLKCIVEVK